MPTIIQERWYDDTVTEAERKRRIKEYHTIMTELPSHKEWYRANAMWDRVINNLVMSEIELESLDRWVANEGRIIDPDEDPEKAKQAGKMMAKVDQRRALLTRRIRTERNRLALDAVKIAKLQPKKQRRKTMQERVDGVGDERSEFIRV